MSSTISIAPQEPKWPVKLIATLLIVTLVGFIPWESIFSVELRSDTLPRLIIGIMGLAGLFILLCTLLLCIMRYDKWYSGLAMLLSPFALIPIAVMLVLNLIAPSEYWQDEAVYRSGNDYLVVQVIDYGVTGGFTRSRIILTPTPYNKIRKVEELHLIGADEDRFSGNAVVYKGRTWLKLQGSGK